jgi:COP9 signalosome complex subunit 4
LYLRLDDTDAAERYLNQARPLFAPSAATGAGAGGADAISASTRARFGIALAQQRDATRKFPEAAQRFLAVARSLDDEQGVHALRGAAICALMSGPSRLRAAVLQALGADERLPRLGDLEVAVLKARDERVLRADDLAAIRPHLQRHHLARNSQHRTLFDVAVVQHNALSASRLYANVSFTDLGAMLGLDPDEAESVVASMAAEGRLAATLDQVRQIVVFPAARPAVARWDAQIEEAGRELTACAEAIARQFPELIPAGGL